MANNNNMEMPKTQTPDSVFLYLGVLVAIAGISLFVLLGLFWGVTLLLLTLAFTTRTYTKNVPGYQALIVLDHLNKSQRTLFQGMNFVLPWESNTEEIFLKVDLKDVLEETYPSSDGMMKTKYVYQIRPDVSGNDPGQKVVLYASYETEAIKMGARALLSMLLSDYYGKHATSELLDKAKINEEVFKQDPGKKSIADFEEEHGVKVTTVRLEDSDRDKATQDAKDSVSRAISFREAVEELMKPGIDGKHMERPEAEKVAKMMNLPGVQEYIISLAAKGVENLRDFTVLGGIGGGKGGKK